MARTVYMTARDMIAGPDTDLQAITYGALVKLANDIINEAPSTVGYPVRRKWAERARRDPSFAMSAALTLCAFSTTIRNKYTADPTGATITDADVETVLTTGNNLWTLIGESL